MPELPEVEVVRRGLAEHVTGCEVQEVRILHPRATRTMSHMDEAVQLLRGKTLGTPRRRGKFLWVPLIGTSAGANTVMPTEGVEAESGSASVAQSPGQLPTHCLLVHLGMSGQMLVNQLEAVGERINPVSSPHIRAEMYLRRGNSRGSESANDSGKGSSNDSNAVHDSDELVVTFVDQRTFGYWAVEELVTDPFADAGSPVSVSEPCPRTEQDLVPKSMTHIAPDPFDPHFDVVVAVEGLKQRSVAIKQALLDQHIVSGIGNIYADEALFRAGVSPRAKARSMSRSRLRAVVGHAAEVMEEALAVGGTSFDSLYVNVNGESGYFSRGLLAYGREAQPCVVCATPLRKIILGGRGTHYCPKCQKR